MVRAQPADTAHSRHATVESERQAIEHGGLTGARLAVHQEQPALPQPVEIDDHAIGERAERGELQAMRPHLRPHPAARSAEDLERLGQQAVLVGIRGGTPHVGHEVTSHREIVTAGQPGAIATRHRHGTFRLVIQQQHLAEPAPEPAHRIRRPAGIGEHHGQVMVFDSAERGIGQQFFEPAADARKLTRDGRRHELRAHSPLTVQIDEPASLPMPGLAERVGKRRTAVTHRLAERLRRVQMAERHVIDAVEQPRPHLADAAHRDVALALTGSSPGDPGVTHDDGARQPAGRAIRTHARHGPRKDARMTSTYQRLGGLRVRRQQHPCGLGLEIGQRIDPDLTGRVSKQQRRPDTPRIGAQMHSGRIHQRRAESQPGGRIMIAADDDDAGTRLTQPDQRILTELDGIERGHRTVVDIAADQDGIDLLRAHRAHQRIKERRLRFPQVSAVKRTAQMPVGGVKESHTRNVGRAADNFRHDRLRACGRSSSECVRPALK